MFKKIYKITKIKRNTMIKESLKSIIDNIALKDYHEKIKMILEYDDNTLRFVLERGVSIDKSGYVILYFHPKVGFVCNNINENYVGKLPICNQIVKILNNRYKELMGYL